MTFAYASLHRRPAICISAAPEPVSTTTSTPVRRAARLRCASKIRTPRDRPTRQSNRSSSRCVRWASIGTKGRACRGRTARTARRSARPSTASSSTGCWPAAICTRASARPRSSRQSAGRHRPRSAPGCTEGAAATSARLRWSSAKRPASPGRCASGCRPARPSSTTCCAPRSSSTTRRSATSSSSVQTAPSPITSRWS